MKRLKKTAAALLAAAFVFLSGCAAVSPASSAVSSWPAKAAVELRVVCDGLKSASCGCPANGELLNAPAASLQRGDTVFTVLQREAEAANLPLHFTGSGEMVYIKGIGGLFEKTCGPASGWVFTVNGQRIVKGAGSVVLQPGDRVEWRYITE